MIFNKNVDEKKGKNICSAVDEAEWDDQLMGDKSMQKWDKDETFLICFVSQTILTWIKRGHLFTWLIGASWIWKNDEI